MINSLYDKPRNDFLMMRYGEMLAPLEKANWFEFACLSGLLHGLYADGKKVLYYYNQVKDCGLYNIHNNFAIAFQYCFDATNSLKASENSFKYIQEDNPDLLRQVIARLNILGRFIEAAEYVRKLKKIKPEDEHMDILFPVAGFLTDKKLETAYQEITKLLNFLIADKKTVSREKQVSICKNNLSNDDVLLTTILLRNATYEQLRDVTLASYDVIADYEIANDVDLDGLRFKFAREVMA